MVERGIIEEIRTGCRDSFNDMTLPFIALRAAGNSATWLRASLAKLVSKNLLAPVLLRLGESEPRRAHLDKSGDLTKATLASSRGARIFPPIVYGGELHVDGGSINNVPST